MKVREARATDREEWLRMLMQLYSRSTEPDHAPAVDAYLRDAEHAGLVPAVVFVGERPGYGLAGFLELSVRQYAEGCIGATPYIESWYVDADSRREGLGGRLVAAAEDWSRARGYEEMASDAELWNTGSDAAHRAVGFTEVERVVHYRKSLRAAPRD